MRGLTVMVVATVAAAACAGESGRGAVTSRDSAGVRIVENQGPSWATGQAWTVVDSPLVDIGGKANEPAYELAEVRGPVRLSDGRLIVGNAATNDIRLYDAAGKHLVSSGRQGSGPGEYQMIMGIWAGPGDSVLVFDMMVRRLTVLDRDGRVGRSFELGGLGGSFVPVGGRVAFSIPVGWSGDGSVVSIGQNLAINQDRPGVYRDSADVIRYAPDGAVRDTLGRFPGPEMETLKLTIGPQTMAVPQPVQLGKQTVTLVDGARFFVAQNDAWEIEIRGLDGKLQTLVRAAVTPHSLTEAEIAEHRKETIETVMGSSMVRNIPEQLKQQMTARYEQAKYPATLPFFAGLLADPLGNLWAQEVMPPGEKRQVFAVVDSAGTFLGRVTMPEDFRPTFIGPDAVFGVWKDAEDVEHVRGYSLRKP